MFASDYRMSSYQDLYAAHVITRARAKAYVYAKLQHLIKSRTKAGYIHGSYEESPISPDVLSGEVSLIVDTPVIKVVVKTMHYPPRNNSRLVIHFVTKR